MINKVISARDSRPEGARGWTVPALVATGVAAGAVAITAVLFPISEAITVYPGSAWGVPGGVLFWTVAALVLSNMWVRGPAGLRFDLSNMAIIAAAVLGGPFAAVFVALVGTTQPRELRGRIPWWGTALNKAGAALTAAVATVLVAPWQVTLRPGVGQPDLVSSLVVSMTMGLILHGLQRLWAVTLLARRTPQRFLTLLRPDPRFEIIHLASLPVGWLCAATYVLIGPSAVIQLAFVFILWRSLSERAAADRDPMTGTLLRPALLRGHARTSRAALPPLTVLVLDLDGFMAVNTIHGHDTGDAVLMEVARRIQAVVLAGTAVARTGGDEFTIATHADGEPSAMIERLSTAIAAPIDVGSEVLHVRCSIGASRADSPEGDLDSAIRAAEAAMYVAKLSGLGRATSG